MSKIVTISRVKFAGKWVELCFMDVLDPTESRLMLNYDMCSKQYRLWEAIERAGAYDAVISSGLQGWPLEIERCEPNWEIKDLLLHSLLPTTL